MWCAVTPNALRVYACIIRVSLLEPLILKSQASPCNQTFITVLILPRYTFSISLAR